MIKIKTYDHERVIRACLAELKDNENKEIIINEAIALMQPEGRLFYKLEDSDTGKLLGYTIEDSNRNSIKQFMR